MHKNFHFRSFFIMAATAMCLSCLDAQGVADEDPSNNGAQPSDAQAGSSSSTKISYSAGSWSHGDSLNILVTYRDFPVTHESFELFDAAWPSLGIGDRQCAEDKLDGREVEGGVYICQDYQVCGTNDSEANSMFLEYGEMGNYGENKRGYIHELQAEGFRNMSWRQKVVVTQGMVAPTLDYSHVPDHASFVDSALYARPVKLNAKRCHNEKLDEWFADVKGVNKRVDDRMPLMPIGSGQYEYVADRNSEDGGFFPLDAYADGSKNTYGKQSLAIWCRPDLDWQTALPLEEKEESGEVLSSEEKEYLYSLRKNADYPDAGCSYWLATGGAKDPEAAKKAAQAAPNLLGSKLHNFGFTMSATLIFQYNPYAQDETGEWLQVLSDDDTWIFLDGQLVADLGGTHIMAPARINLNEQGMAHAWKEGSTHVFNIYKAERNTDESVFSIKSTLSSLMKIVN